MHVHRQALAGIQELDEHAGVSWFRIAAAEPVDGIRDYRITKQGAIGQAGGSEVRVAEASHGRANPLLR
jgi:hypothetical protein